MWVDITLSLCLFFGSTMVLGSVDLNQHCPVTETSLVNYRSSDSITNGYVGKVP